MLCLFKLSKYFSGQWVWKLPRLRFNKTFSKAENFSRNTEPPKNSFVLGYKIHILKNYTSFPSSKTKELFHVRRAFHVPHRGTENFSSPDLICSSFGSRKRAARNNVIYIFIRINGPFSSYIFSFSVCALFSAWHELVAVGISSNIFYLQRNEPNFRKFLSFSSLLWEWIAKHIHIRIVLK